MNSENYRSYKEAVKKLINDSKLVDKNIDNYVKKIQSNKILGSIPYGLYRYRKFSEYTLAEIIDQEIYLSSIDQFDDKYDSRYIYKPFGYHSEKEKELIRWNNEETKKKIDLVNKHFIDHLRVACFTQDYKNIPMWYYYADQHKGVCIKYSSKNVPNDEILLPVVYPKIKEASYFNFFPNESQMQCGALLNSIVKNDSWKFEKEWRLIRYVDSDEPQYVKWDISEIYFGCDSSYALIQDIKKIIIKNGLKISLYKMEMGTVGLIAVKV